MDDPHNAETPEARFGAELRRLRLHASLSVRRLADELHRSHSSIVEYEGGRRLAPVEVVEQYELYFDLPRGTLGAQRERARAERLEAPRDGTVDEDLGEVSCPYKGLRPFEHDDAPLFFGREAQVEQVLARLAAVRFVAVVGASGSGKSSFVRAGLLAGIGAQALNGGTSARVALLTPGEHPLDELATAVTAATGGAARVASDDLRTDPDRLERATRQGGDARLVIVVDQFEELFTLCRESAERRCFVDALIAAWRDPSSPVVVIIALRADFYGRVAAYPELAAAVVAHQTLIGPMSSADLRRAIELPAAGRGLVLQPGLVQTMLEDLADEPGALPLLSHALLETWKRRRRLQLTVGGYREAGGVRGAIAQTAERTLQTLPADDRAIARSVFLSLTELGEGAEPTRRRVDRAELAGQPESADALDRLLGILADERLVTLDERTVVVAHEALIRHWPRLRGWIDADRAGLLVQRRLTDAAREWEALDRDPGALYRGARLATAREWAAEHHLSELERDFLAASHAAEHSELDAARRRTHRLRFLATGLAALAVIVAALAVWALDQRDDARRQAAESRSLALTSASASPLLLDSRPEVSLLLALEAYRASPRAEARSSVAAALTAARDPGVLAILHGHAKTVRSMAFSPDGRTLASASDDGTARLWDVRTRKPLGAPLTGPTGYVYSVAFGPDGRTLASAGYDGTVRLWDVRTRKPLGAPLRGDTGVVESVAFSRDGRTLAVVGFGRTVRWWDVRTRKRLGGPLDGDSGFVGATFGPDGRTLASAGDDGTVRLWDVRTRKPLGVPLTGHTGDVISAAFAPDGRTLASGSSDRTVRLWDVPSRKQLGRPLRGHAKTALSLAFSPDGRTLASAGEDRTIRLWDVRTGKPLGEPLTGHTDTVVSLAFGPDGRTLASAGVYGTIRLWDVRTGKPPRGPLTGHTDAVKEVAFAPDGRTLASAGLDGTVRVWDVRARRQRGAPLTGHTDVVESVAFSSDGRTLASAGWDGTVRVWDVRARRQRGAPLTGHTGLVSGVAFAPDGRTLASASSDRTVRLWDVRARRQRGAPLSGHTDAVESVAFSSDGRTLASASSDRTVRLWDVRTHKALGAPLAGHTSYVASLAFSPDGRTLASADIDEAVRLWDVRTHKPLGLPLTDHSDSVRSVAFSPDGRTLASASDDRTVRLWDVRTRRPLGAPLTGHTSHVSSVAFSPDGRTLASASYDDTIRLWTGLFSSSFAELQTEVCKLVGSGLDRTEWAQHVAGVPYRQSCP